MFKNKEGFGLRNQRDENCCQLRCERLQEEQVCEKCWDCGFGHTEFEMTARHLMGDVALFVDRT